MDINYNLPELAIGFTRSKDFIGRLIQFFRRGLHSSVFPNHAFFVVYFNWQVFVIEETLSGLRLNSIDEYRKDSNRISCIWYWGGFSDVVIKQRALDRMTYILRKQGDPDTRLGKYDLVGLLKFVPIIGRWIQPSREAEWCSENCADILKFSGCPWVTDIHLAPDELARLMSNQGSCREERAYREAA